MSRICCILPQISQYNVLHHFTRKVGEALMRAGHDVSILTYEEGVKACTRKSPDLTLAFNGAPLVSKSFFLCDLINVPHYAFLVDPPFYYLNLLESPYIRICCDDRDNIPILKHFGYKDSPFFTQGVEPELSYDANDPRELDIVFFGSYFDIDVAKEKWEAEYSPELREVMQAAIDATFLDETLSLPVAFRQALAGREELMHKKNKAVLLYWLSYVQKGLARIQLLDSIRHLKVHVWDKRWEKYFGDQRSNIILHEAVDYQTSLDLMKKAKLVLCNSIRSVNGCNERVLNSLACGAVPVSNANPYFREAFKEGEHLLFYTPQDLPSLEVRLKELLENEDKRAELAAAGRAEVMERHTWDARLRDLGEL